MKLLILKDILDNKKDYLNKEIKLDGWVKNVRTSKNIGFIELNDGSDFKSIQIVFDNSLENYNNIKKITIGSSISIVGDLIKSLNDNQEFEIKAKSINIICKNNEDYPLQKKRHTLEYLRNIAHLRPRTNTFKAIFRIRSITSYAIHKFFNDSGFYYINTPIITTSDCEGAGEMFSVEKSKNNNKNFFGKETFLTVSGQLSAETLIYSLRNVYTFGPTFRAENSNTPRHAAEFWMIEPEMAFVDLRGCMNCAEKMLRSVVSYVLKNAKDELDFCNKFINNNIIERLENIIDSKFKIMEYTDAIEILKESKREFEYDVEWGIDLQTEHEKFLTNEFAKSPLFIVNYPKNIKAFYMRMNNDNKTVAAMDLLVPDVGEIIGGSQREERYEILLDKIKKDKLDEKDYWWYLDLRKYGSVIHSGFGMGLERLVMYLTGISNIRDVIPYPRTVNSANF
ncbi:MAG: asparagine--tRNA ligase [Clostridiales bacterium]|nr:asparagine--tRNA ligase [Clostridiales bacterium]